MPVEIKLRPFHYACIGGSAAIAVVAVIIAIIVFSPRPEPVRCAKDTKQVMESMDQTEQVQRSSQAEQITQPDPQFQQQQQEVEDQPAPVQLYSPRSVVPAQRKRKTAAGKQKMGIRLHAPKKRSLHVQMPEHVKRSSENTLAPLRATNQIGGTLTQDSIRYSSSAQVIPRSVPRAAATNVMEQTQLASRGNYRSFRGRSVNARADLANKVSRLHMNRALKRPGYVSGKGVGLPRTMRRVPVELR